MTCPHCSKESPAGAAECPSCGLVFAKLKTASAVRTIRREESSWLLTTALLALLCGGVFGAYTLMDRRAEPQSDMSGNAVRPDGYRQSIQAIEKVLYKDASATPQDAKFMSDAAVLLAGAILERNPGNPFAASAAGELMEFSVAAGTAQDSLKDARADWARRWEALRGRRFERAPWFHAPVNSSAGSLDADRAAARLLEGTRSLEALVASLPAELEPFGETGVDPASLEAAPAPAADPFSPYAQENTSVRSGDPKAKDRGRLEAWQAWRTAWQGRVDKVIAGLPNPGEVPDALRSSYDGLVGAAQAARRPPGKEALPAKAQREAWAEGLAERVTKLRPAQQ